VSIKDAIKYADEVRGAYRDALANQGLLSTTLGVVLIPLTGVIAYQGITGVSTKTIAATSIVGASLLGAGIYLHSSPRQIIYAETAAAITCAISVVAPLQLSKDDEDHLRTLVQWKYSKEGTQPEPSTENAQPGPSKEDTQPQHSTGDTQQEPSTGDSKTNLPYILLRVSEVPDPKADKLAEQIRIGIASGREALAIIDMAGSQLVSTVDGIMDMADKQIASTIPDPRSLSSGLGGLIPVPKVGAVDLPTLKDLEKEPVKGPKPEAETPLDTALKRAGTTRNQILAELTFISGVAERIREVSVKSALSGCGGALENITTAFRLVPEATTVSFTFEKGGEHRSVVVGGKPPYFASLLRKPEVGTLTAEILSEPAGYQLRINADTNVKAGDYPVAVRDSSAAEPKIITVRIEEKSTNSPQPTPGGAEKSGATK
jgi:hypothetical protein